MVVIKDNMCSEYCWKGLGEDQPTLLSGAVSGKYASAAKGYETSGNRTAVKTAPTSLSKLFSTKGSQKSSVERVGEMHL